MKNPENFAPASLPAFIRRTVRETPGKIPATLLALLIYYWLPLMLTGKNELLMTGMLAPPVIACAIVFITQPRMTSRQTGSTQDHHSMAVLMLVTIASQVTVTIDWANRANTVFHWNVITIVGLIFIAGGLFIRVWAIMELGKYFDNSVRILDDHEIVVTGPYKYVRHASYTGIYLLAIGIAIYLSSWWGLAVSVLSLGLGYRYRIEQEERAMYEAFGSLYRDYCQRTYRMFPYIW